MTMNDGSVGIRYERQEIFLKIFFLETKAFTVFAVASCVCFRTATLVAVCPVQRYTSSIVLTGQLRARRLRPRKSITYSLDKNQLKKLL